jgi:hypothetical protein
MRMSIRAGALLAGVATACAIPAVALGQIDPGQVGNTVTGVTKQVPQVPQQVQKQLPSLPSTPVTKAPSSGSNGSAPRSSAPSHAGGSGSSPSTSTRSSSGSASTGSGRSASGSAQSARPKAHAASSKKHASSGKNAVSGQTQSAAPGNEPKKVANVSDTARPSTGTEGDSKLPFTGYALIAVGLLGLIALVTGFGLRGASRLRFARRRA